MKKMGIVTAVLLIAVLTLAGCGGTPEIKRPQPSEGAVVFAVEGSCEAVLEDGVLTVSGATNLMDGTNGVIKVMNSDGTTAEEAKFTKLGESISHDFPVKDDWEGRVYGFISFDTQQANRQPREVTDAYGKKFENLEGENAIWNMSGVIAIFESEMVEIG